MGNTIKRKVYFYDIKASLNGQSVDVHKIINHIDSLPFDGDTATGRYYPIADGNMRSVVVDSAELPIKAVVGTRRNNGLPVQESGGVVTPLELMPGHGLYEPSHFMIFKDNIMAMEYNHHGPRSAGLKSYILKKCKGIVDAVEINYLWQPDVLKMLSTVRGIRTIQLKVSQYGTHNYDNDHVSLWKALGSFQNIEPGYINLVLGTDGTRKGLNIGFREIVDMVKKPEIADGLAALKVTPIEGGEFDLISPYLLSTTRVTKQDDTHNCVNSDSMFEEIERAYSQSKPLIEASRIGMQT